MVQIDSIRARRIAEQLEHVASRGAVRCVSDRDSESTMSDETGGKSEVYGGGLGGGCLAPFIEEESD